MALDTGALKLKDVRRVRVGTAVQPKTVAFLTDAMQLYTSIARLWRLCRAHGVPLR